MNDRVSALLKQTGPIFCLDIGSGTQDALLALPDENYDNWPRFVLPAPARNVASVICAATQKRKAIWLYGGNMGGGFSDALKAHCAAGLSAYATEAASKAIHDNPETVEKMGIHLTEHCPKASLPIHLTDYSQEYWLTFFRSLNLPLPELVIASAQDHGFCPTGNRVFRMQTWAKLLSQSDEPANWLYDDVPAYLTRLTALKAECGGYVADTGTSSLLAFLCDSAILARSFKEGVTLVNAGNTHVLAALVFRGRIQGLYEQHTALLSEEQLAHDLNEFRLGWLPAEVVQKAYGHGTVYGERSQEAGGFDPTYLTGPQRERFQGLGRLVHPCGDMMVAGCFGLLNGLAQTKDSTTL